MRWVLHLNLVIDRVKCCNACVLWLYWLFWFLLF